MKDNQVLPSKLYCRLFYAGLVTILLSACSGRDMNDLEEYVAKIKAKENPHVDAIPDFRHIPSYFYEVQHMRDPFEPLVDTQTKEINIALGEGQDGKKKVCPSPEDSNRVRVGLELMPLDALQMVGTLQTQSDQGYPILWALVVSKSDGTIYRVKQGDYLGENYGQIINVSEDEIEVLEQVPDGEGCWKDQLAKISLFSS